MAVTLMTENRGSAHPGCTAPVIPVTRVGKIRRCTSKLPYPLAPDVPN